MTQQEATHIINNGNDYTPEQREQAREIIVEACMKTHEQQNLIYLEILNSIPSESEFRDWMKTPFKTEYGNCATDGKIMVLTPLFDEPMIDRTNNIKPIFPVEPNCSIQILVSELKEGLSKVPLIDCFDNEENECSECGGEGEVDFEYSCKGKTHTVSGECPMCEGSGTVEDVSTTPNGEKEYKNGKYIEMHHGIFAPLVIEKLVFIGDKLGVDSLELYNHQGGYKPYYFKAKEVRIIAMGLISTNDEDIVYTIK
jgi:hypothetical protein